ncbi:hypothetical protein M514_06265 [Trichuris suis]|uniref:Uncharacterized protein n=1 Tax=Trichuris suis TaxID=68888 RepID=A0A085NR37_9BILA|nr:hypothetical protein M513_06265 [Trichuris suis]KFD71933.1 hypothetical protein M514_06265 [Trichuris suis]
MDTTLAYEPHQNGPASGRAVFVSPSMKSATYVSSGSTHTGLLSIHHARDRTAWSSEDPSPTSSSSTAESTPSQSIG